MKEANFRLDRVSLEEHPAAKAWQTLGGALPQSVEVLARGNGTPLNQKSSIYRLNGVGVGGRAVIAKYSRQWSMAVERLVHDEILPALPLSRLHYYGSLEEKERGLCWLFLEDAAGVQYAERSAAHRALASDWLGTMHAATAPLALRTRLPELSLARYLAGLKQARQTIAYNLGSLKLKAEERGTLRAIIRHCDALEARWSEIEEVWQAMPQCLVHTDFIAKNVRVRTEPVATLLVMDWEYAAWGVPAEDIAGLDAEIYWSRTRDVWPEIGMETIRQLETLGRMFQSLDWIRVTADGLGSDWSETALTDLEIYEARFARARAAAGWS